MAVEYPDHQFIPCQGQPILALLRCMLTTGQYFGWIESLGGALKVVMLAVITFILFFLAGRGMLFYVLRHLTNMAKILEQWIKQRKV